MAILAIERFSAPGNLCANNNLMDGTEFVFFITIAATLAGMFYAYWLIAFVPNAKPKKEEP